eukprot:gene44016-54699_t
MNNVYISEYGGATIRKVSGTNGIITRIAGTTTAGYSGDGGQATSAMINVPYQIFGDSSNNLYIADSSNSNVRIMNLQTNVIALSAGGGDGGDGAKATSSLLTQPFGVWSDTSNNVYIAEYGGNKIRCVSATTGLISTFAGGGVAAGNNVAATSVVISAPRQLFGSVVIVDGVYVLQVYIAEGGAHKVRIVSTASNIITIFAGTGTAATSDVVGPATSTNINGPFGVWINPSGQTYLAEYTGQKVKSVSSAGIMTTVAGTGAASTSAGLINGDGGNPTSASLNNPYMLFADTSGNVLIGDYGNNKIRNATPSALPTSQPSSSPSGRPSSYPSTHPTSPPTSQPSSSPSSGPSSRPSAQPSGSPTD